VAKITAVLSLRSPCGYQGGIVEAAKEDYRRLLGEGRRPPKGTETD
jgi:hypothetical protein